MKDDNPLHSLPNEYPVELSAPDIEPYASGASGLPYVQSFHADADGPHVAIAALVHGNELCGAIALDRLLREAVRPVRGTLSLVFVNVAAHGTFDPEHPNASRWVDEDFNRLWSADILDGPRDSVELTRARELRPFFDGVDLLLDIHSMQHRTQPLMMAGTEQKGIDLARSVGVPEVIVADAGHAAGPRLRDYAGFSDPSSPRNAVLVECGQHWEAGAADVALETAVRFLRATGTVGRDVLPEVAAAPSPPQRLLRITDRVTIESEEFSFARPFRGFEILADAGTLIGHDGERPVLSPYDDCVLIMPSKRLWRGQTAVRLGHFVQP